MGRNWEYFCGIFVVVLGCCQASKLQTYNASFAAYEGVQLTQKQLDDFIAANLTFWCTNKVKLPCDPNEGRRVDATCNNLKYPSRGAYHTPNARLLPAAYDTDFGVRRAKSGNNLPEARVLRTSLVTEGDVPDQVFTYYAAHNFMSFYTDVVNAHDTVNYIVWRTNCCTPEGKKDKMCAPIKIPDDDPVHRFTNIRCMNLTRPITYQNQGCVSNNNTVPSRLTTTTPFFDLNYVYGNADSIQNIRSFKNGELKYVVENGRKWPPNYPGLNVCTKDEATGQTTCKRSAVTDLNWVTSGNIAIIWKWRYHNKIASELRNVNPCWSDEKIFNTARDLNIAITSHIDYYDLFANLLGRENLVRDGIILDKPGFRDLYDEEEVPELFVEFPIIGRWVHIFLPGKLSVYDTDGNYLRQYENVNITLSTGWLTVDDHIDILTQGAIRQPIGKIDNTVDPEIGQRGFGFVQRAHDLMAFDLMKNRYLGLPSYTKYRELCSGKLPTSFDDLLDVISPDRVEMLRNQYENVEDIDLLPGVWLENKMEGSNVPPTFYCLFTKQLVKNMKMDRHWHERPNRPNKFTERQINEIWKASGARMLCDVGDKITKIQPQAFLRPRNGNLPVPCSEIPNFDWTAWKDETCQSQ